MLAIGATHVKQVTTTTFGTGGADGGAARPPHIFFYYGNPAMSGRHGFKGTQANRVFCSLKGNKGTEFSHMLQNIVKLNNLTFSEALVE